MTKLTPSKARTRAAWPLAIHESAHVIVARRLGVSVSQATIQTDHDSCAHILHGAASVYQNILIGLAGPAAERRLGRRGSECDPALADEDAEYWALVPEFAAENGVTLNDDPDDPAERQWQLRDIYNALVAEVQQLLTTEWGAVEHFALALMVHRTLTARMVALCDAA